MWRRIPHGGVRWAERAPGAGAAGSRRRFARTEQQREDPDGGRLRPLTAWVRQVCRGRGRPVQAWVWLEIRSAIPAFLSNMAELIQCTRVMEIRVRSAEKRFPGDLNRRCSPWSG